MLSCGFNAISIEDVVDVEYINRVKNELNSPTMICENISTNESLLLGTPQDVKKEVRIALEKVWIFYVLVVQYHHIHLRIM